MSFGFILSKMVSIIDQPLGVADKADLQRVLQHMGEVDWLEYVRQQKPNSKWQITLLTNIAFHVYPLVDRPLRGVERRASCPSGWWRIKVWIHWKKTSRLTVICWQLVLFSMLGTTPRLQFKKLGKKERDQRIGLSLFCYAGKSGEPPRPAFERFAHFR